jgi:hypothetical protein
MAGGPQAETSIGSAIAWIWAALGNAIMFQQSFLLYADSFRHCTIFARYSNATISTLT